MASKKKDNKNLFFDREWVQKFIEKRSGNDSNAYVFSTIDSVRWKEIGALAKNREFSELRPVYVWDMLENRFTIYSPKVNEEGKVYGVEVKALYPSVEAKTNPDTGEQVMVLTLKELPDPTDVPANAPPPEVAWKFVTALLRKNRATLILRATGLSPPSQEYYSRFLNYIIDAVAKDDMIFATKSTLIVIVPSSEYISESARKLSVVIEPPLSAAEEREMHIMRELEKLKKVWLSTAKTEKEKLAIERKYKKLVSQVNEEVINAGAGLTLDEVVGALLQSITKYKEIRAEAFKEYKIDFLRKMGIEYIEPEYGFEAVGGYDDLKEYVKDMVHIIKNPEEAKEYGDSVPRGLLLYGLPGTGKTWFAHALAKELNLPVVKLSPADFLRGIVGETESRIKQITQIIDSISPAVVFIDEIDQLGMERGGDTAHLDAGVSRRMTNMLLEWLGDKNRKAFIVGATNNLKDMDDAFIRTGRIDNIVFVPTPDLEARKEILEIHMLKINPINTEKIKFNPDILWNVAKNTEYWRGSDLEALCKKVKRIARKEGAKEITMEHFKKAMEGMGINETELKKKQEKLLLDLRKKADGGNVDLEYVERVERQLGIKREMKVDDKARSNVKVMSFDDGLGIGL